MTVFVMLLALIVGSVLQASLPAFPRLGYAQLPILVSVVMYYALTASRAEVVWAALLAGVLEDTVGLMPLGYSALCFCVIALTTWSYRDIVIAHQWTTHVALGMMANCTVMVLSYILLAKDGLIDIGIWAFISKLFFAALFGAVVVPVVFRVLESLDQMVGNTEAESL